MTATAKQDQPICVCLGLGVDSVAMLVGMEQRGIRPDLITFADTGGEKPATYLYAPILRQWLRDVDFPQFQTCRYVPPIATYRTLYENCERHETIPSLAFGRKACSLKWKRDAQEPLRKRLPENVQAWSAGRKVIKCIGFDATERRRTYAAVGKELDEYDYSYPLQDWGWTRDHCKRVIADAGLPVPVKSACFFCPAMKKAEIHELRRTDPDLYEKAIALETGYREGKHWRGDAATTQGLGRRFAWATLPVIQDRQLTLFDCGG
ncbi:MAG: phosphoadenosine phosphosulfate reductase [Planctomycetes bacterium]|nr:phosphoadenosine phosphosulfate reductase [Planctomycetota bacterium]